MFVVIYALVLAARWSRVCLTCEKGHEGKERELSLKCWCCAIFGRGVEVSDTVEMFTREDEDW